MHSNFLPYKHKMGLDHHPANKTETQKNRFTYISERPDEANFLIQRQSFCIRKICCSLLCFSLQSVMNLTNPDHTSSERITFQFTFSNNRENSVVLIVCCNLLPHAIRTTWMLTLQTKENSDPSTRVCCCHFPHANQNCGWWNIQAKKVFLI